MHLHVHPDVPRQVSGTEWTVTLTGQWHGHLCGLTACESHLRFSWQMLQISLPRPESASDLLATWSELNPNLGMRAPSVACPHCDPRSVHGREHRQLQQLSVQQEESNVSWYLTIDSISEAKHFLSFQLLKFDHFLTGDTVGCAGSGVCEPTNWSRLGIQEEGSSRQKQLSTILFKMATVQWNINLSVFIDISVIGQYLLALYYCIHINVSLCFISETKGNAGSNHVTFDFRDPICKLKKGKKVDFGLQPLFRLRRTRNKHSKYIAVEQTAQLQRSRPLPLAHKPSVSTTNVILFGECIKQTWQEEVVVMYICDPSPCVCVCVCVWVMFDRSAAAPAAQFLCLLKQIAPQQKRKTLPCLTHAGQLLDVRCILLLSNKTTESPDMWTATVSSRVQLHVAVRPRLSPKLEGLLRDKPAFYNHVKLKMRSHSHTLEDEVWITERCSRNHVVSVSQGYFVRLSPKSKSVIASGSCLKMMGRNSYSCSIPCK